jgi:phosphoglycerate dehydrogenase-like enzyme
VQRIPLVVATPLEAELVDEIRAVDERFDVRFEPELLPEPRYPSDHRGDPAFRRPEADQARFTHLVAGAEILYGIPGDTAAGLTWGVRTASGLRFLQATAAGAGEQVRGAALSPAELERVAICSASGVHAVPLAEWSLFGLLAFAKGLPRLLANTRERGWPHYAVPELRGQTLLVVGVGEIGREVARLAGAFGMRVVGVKRDVSEPVPGVESMHALDALPDVVGSADAIVVTLPLTDETRGIVDASTIARMKHGVVFVNVGRGGVVDEEALIAALDSGRVGGAALDVFATEPLPADSPLWTHPNVLISPHTSALSVHENERIVELFCENLRRYLRGDELLSRIRTSVFY